MGDYHSSSISKFYPVTRKYTFLLCPNFPTSPKLCLLSKDWGGTGEGSVDWKQAAPWWDSSSSCFRAEPLKQERHHCLQRAGRKHGWLRRCYGLNACVSPQIPVLSPNPQGDGVRRWGLWEVMRSWGWCPHDGISVLTEEIPEGSLAPSSTWGHREKMPSRSQEEPSPDTQSAGTLFLDFQPPELWEIVAVHKLHSLRYFLVKVQMGWASWAERMETARPWEHRLLGEWSELLQDQSALTVILILVMQWSDQRHPDCFKCSSSSVPGSVCSHFTWSQFSELWQLMSWLQSGHRVVNCFHLVGVSVSIRQLTGMAQNIIYSPWEGTKGPWLCLLTKLLLFCPVSLLFSASAFSHFLIQLILWLKFFHRQKAGRGHGRGVGGDHRVLFHFRCTDYFELKAFEGQQMQGELPLNPLICLNTEPPQELGVLGPLLGASPPGRLTLVPGEEPRSGPHPQTDRHQLPPSHPSSKGHSSSLENMYCPQRGLHPLPFPC